MFRFDLKFEDFPDEFPEEWDEGGAGAWGKLGIEGVTEGVDVREFVEVAGVSAIKINQNVIFF